MHPPPLPGEPSKCCQGRGPSRPQPLFPGPLPDSIGSRPARLPLGLTSSGQSSRRPEHGHVTPAVAHAHRARARVRSPGSPSGEEASRAAGNRRARPVPPSCASQLGYPDTALYSRSSNNVISFLYNTAEMLWALNSCSCPPATAKTGFIIRRSVTVPRTH